MNSNPSTQARLPHHDLLASWKSRSTSSLKDTLTSRRHSRDFSFARADYMRSRVMIIGIIFLILSPFWAILDTLMLPEPTSQYALTARVAMTAGLLTTILIAWRSRYHLRLIQLTTAILFALPTGLYVFFLSTLPDTWHGNLIGYSFIPFMLAVMLAIFPLTLIESALLGLLLLAVQIYALYVGQEWLTLQGIEQIWLLAALLFITAATNYFHLGLLLRLYREATHDPLTGLLNRGALMQNANQIRTDKQAQPLALLMLDLDHFKRVNDQYGHSAGDLVLNRFAEVLRSSVRPNDIVARYGGEEFTAILINTNKSDAMKTAERIRKKVETTSITTPDGQTLRVTVSIGVASLYPDEPLDTATQRADQRLYEAKKLARNCVVGV